MKRRPRIGRIRRHVWKNGNQRIEGIALRSDSRLVAHLTPSEAYKLADRIVDAVEKLEQNQ